jgi:DNA-damage-inducible protein D
MKIDIIHSLTDAFESHAQQTEGGVEFWLARDLQHLLGYSEWRNFTAVISQAKTACEVSDHAISDHFVDINKMVDLRPLRGRVLLGVVSQLHTDS